ncbi:O-antigen ligase family protein [Lentzea sp. NPDC004789]
MKRRFRPPDGPKFAGPSHFATDLGATGAVARFPLSHLSIYVALAWGLFARGAFFASDLYVFVALAAVVVVLHGTGSNTRPDFWWLLNAGFIGTAIMASAVANDAVSDGVHALLPVVAATFLGAAATSIDALEKRVLVIRAVVDVIVLVAVVSWIGVAFHLEIFAHALDQGWRAEGTLGYANVAGIILTTGALCAAGLARISQRRPDEIRCAVVIVGLLATQSRGAIAALVVAGFVLWRTSRPTAMVLWRSSGWAIVTFAGLLPSVHSDGAQPVGAVVGLCAALMLTFFASSDTTPTTVRRVVLGLPVAAGALVVALSRDRILDHGSGQGRTRLWSDGWNEAGQAWIFGRGPHEIAAVSKGEITVLFLHNDLLQFFAYYGLAGLLAVGLIVNRIVRAFARTKLAEQPEMRAVGLAVCAAVALAALLDFPLQIPVVPAIASLVVGLTTQPPAIDAVPSRKGVSS